MKLATRHPEDGRRSRLRDVIIFRRRAAAVVCRCHGHHAGEARRSASRSTCNHQNRPLVATVKGCFLKLLVLEVAQFVWRRPDNYVPTSTLIRRRPMKVPTI